MVEKQENLVKERLNEDIQDLKTCSKTYRFFETDINYMLNKGLTPKQLLRKGRLADEENPQLIARIRELEQGNDKLQRRLTAIYQNPNIQDILVRK